MHSFDWKGVASPEGFRPPKNPGPLSPEAQQARAPHEVEVTIHHHGGHSGNVKINIPTWVGNPSTAHYTAGGEDYHIAELNVPFEALKQFVLEYYRSKVMSMLEGAEGPVLEAIVGPTLYKEALAGFKPQHTTEAVEQAIVKHATDGSCCSASERNDLPWSNSGPPSERNLGRPGDDKLLA